jgi:hypothetical protein
LAGHIPFINAGHLPVYCQNSIAGITGPGNHNNINNNNNNIETPSTRIATPPPGVLVVPYTITAIEYWVE